jgi:cytochrome c-type biogenesis protein CcmE
MTVVSTAAVPSLFRDGKGVVVEGEYGGDGAFHADTVLVKHGDRYAPPEPGETPHSAEVEAGG